MAVGTWMECFFLISRSFWGLVRDTQWVARDKMEDTSSIINAYGKKTTMRPIYSSCINEITLCSSWSILPVNYIYSPKQMVVSSIDRPEWKFQCQT